MLLGIKGAGLWVLLCQSVLSPITPITVNFNDGSGDLKGTSVLDTEIGVWFSIQISRKINNLFGSIDVDEG